MIMEHDVFYTCNSCWFQFFNYFYLRISKRKHFLIYAISSGVESCWGFFFILNKNVHCFFFWVKLTNWRKHLVEICKKNICIVHRIHWTMLLLHLRYRWRTVMFNELVEYFAKEISFNLFKSRNVCLCQIYIFEHFHFEWNNNSTFHVMTSITTFR